MIDNYFHKLSPFNQANVILIVGLILLVNALDLVKGLNLLIILISLGLIWYGFTLAGYARKIMSLFKKSPKKGSAG